MQSSCLRLILLNYLVEFMRRQTGLVLSGDIIRKVPVPSDV